MENPLILLIGGGKMGQALLQGWLASGAAPSHILVVEPASEIRTHIEKAHGVKCVSAQRDVPQRFVPQIVVLAVKPQIMADITAECAVWAGRGALFISIAAGKTLAFFALYLGKNAAVVRAMPNLPALIGKGVTAYIANNMVSEKQARMAEELLCAVGSAHRLRDESLMDAVTAISGSGPAYVFYFMECLVQAATQLGLPNELAVELVSGLLKGSVELACDADQSLESLRAGVTSSGGTTQAALAVLMRQNGLDALLLEAAKAAHARSKELSE